MEMLIIDMYLKISGFFGKISNYFYLKHTRKLRRRQMRLGVRK